MEFPIMLMITMPIGLLLTKYQSDNLQDIVNDARIKHNAIHAQVDTETGHGGKIVLTVREEDDDDR